MTNTVRIPSKFFDAQGLDCQPVRRTDRFVWIRRDDPAVADLLWAAEFDAAEESEDRSARRSAASAERAIREAMLIGRAAGQDVRGFVSSDIGPAYWAGLAAAGLVVCLATDMLTIANFAGTVALAVGTSMGIATAARSMFR